MAKNGITPIGIIDLLKLRGFDESCPTKLVRHQDSRCDVHELIHNGWLDFYQSGQNRPVFDRCERIVSFVGSGKTKARFIGVFKVLHRREESGIRPPSGFPVELATYKYFYDLKRESGYEDLENRIVIEWGAGTKQFVQWLSNKEVIEVLPSGQTLPPPPREYLDFTLKHSELRELYQREDANREWRARLAAVAGVYLVLATTEGKQYVGSASGVNGIWGRWESYASNGHGNNKLLKALLARDPRYPDSFTYSILQVLPRTLAAKEVIKYEHRYMKKLGSCVSGLNS